MGRRPNRRSPCAAGILPDVGESFLLVVGNVVGGAPGALTNGLRLVIG